MKTVPLNRMIAVLCIGSAAAFAAAGIASAQPATGIPDAGSVLAMETSPDGPSAIFSVPFQKSVHLDPRGGRADAQLDDAHIWVTNTNSEGGLYQYFIHIDGPAGVYTFIDESGDVYTYTRLRPSWVPGAGQVGYASDQPTIVHVGYTPIY